MNGPQSRSRFPLLPGLANGVATGACWGTVFVAPAMVPDFTPLQLSTARYIAYGAISILLVLPRWRQLHSRIVPKEWIALLWLGLTGNLGYYILISSAVRLCGIDITSIMTGFLPVIIGILGTREKDGLGLRRLVPSMLLMLVGLGLTAMQTLHSGNATAGTDVTRLTGFALAIGGLASWSIFALSNARWLKRLSTISADDWSLLTGIATGAEALLLLPFAVHPDAASHPVSGWLAFAAVSGGVALIASVMGGIFWNRTCQMLPMTLSGQMAVGETLFALFYGCLWTGRLPTAIETAAVVFLMLSVISSALAHAPAREERTYPGKEQPGHPADPAKTG